MNASSSLTQLVAALFVVLPAADLIGTDVAHAGQLGLQTAIDKPVLLADSQQTAYLRVALTGFDLDDRGQRPPVNIALVIDISGSMRGEKIARAKEAAIMAIDRLGAADIISVVTYQSTVDVLIPATKVTDKQAVFRKIRNINAGGSTALFAGVSKGAEEVRKFLADDRPARLVLLSDGLANVGPQTPAELGALGNSLIKEGISVTTIGLGLNYNEDLMTRLAYESDGNHYFVEEAGKLAAVFDSEFGQALSIVARDIRTQITCAPGVRPVRLLGRSGTINGQKVFVLVNQLHSKHEKFILLEVEVPPTPADSTRPLATVSVTYDNMRTGTSDRLGRSLEVSFTRSKELVEARTNATVAVDVVELIAAERNALAVQLRDAGKIEDARRNLLLNERYLRSNAWKWGSTRLGDYAFQNAEDADKLEDREWGKQRKIMRADQLHRSQQQQAGRAGKR